MNNRIGPFVVSTEHRVPDSPPVLVNGLESEPRKKLVEDIAHLVLSKKEQFHRVAQLTAPEIDLLRDLLDEWDQVELRRYLDLYLSHIKKQLEGAMQSVVI
jgi:hypothetical protein